MGWRSLRKSLRWTSLNDWRASTAWRTGLPIVLGAILLVQIGRIGWIFLASPEPPEGSGAPSRADVAILRNYDPFAGAAPVVEVDNQGYGLFGVSADGDGGGSAIIGLPDGSQVSVAVGETVAPDVTLRSVGFDHVTLARGQALSRVYFPDIAPVVTTGLSPDSSQDESAGEAEAPALIDVGELMGEAALRPRMDGLAISGLTVTASDDTPALAHAGLQSGDVILSVNGTALNSPQSLNVLRQKLANAPSAEISFERGGQRRMISIRTK